jgi:hypothetical protein
MIRVASGEQLRMAGKVAFDLAGCGSFCALRAMDAIRAQCGIVFPGES